MAIIHGRAASTQFLLDKMPMMDGHRFESLTDIQLFYDNYTGILSETESAARKQIDGDIAKKGAEEVSLNGKLKETRDLKRKELTERIQELNNEIRTSRGIFSKLLLRLKVIMESSSFEDKVTRSGYQVQSELIKVQNERAVLINKKDSIVNEKCGRIRFAYRCIEDNKTFLIGAYGEEEVIEQLALLPDEFHVFNDVKIRFSDWVYWRNGADNDKNIKTSQIDHLVVGPTGIFLIETKNWKTTDIKNKQNDLVYQIHRANFALWFYLKKVQHIDCEIKTRCVAASIQGNGQWQKIDNHIFLMLPYSLPKYITWGKPVYTSEQVKKIASIFI